MKYSIIIPSYGQAQYLRAAIESALAQNWYHVDKYEIIVVDDGSTDGSLDIAKEYSPRVKVIHQTNRGLSAARNTGIMAAKGEWIIPLDADDIMYPNALEVLSSHDSINLGVVAPSIECFNEDTGATQNTTLIENPTFEDFKEGNRLAYFAAIRRDRLVGFGGYSTKMDSLGGWEDLHLWYNFLIANKNGSYGLKIKTLQIPLLKYRIKEHSMWKEAEKNKAALWAQLVKDFPEVKDHVKS